MSGVPVAEIHIPKTWGPASSSDGQRSFWYAQAASVTTTTTQDSQDSGFSFAESSNRDDFPSGQDSLGTRRKAPKDKEKKNGVDNDGFVIAEVLTVLLHQRLANLARQLDELEIGVRFGTHENV